MSTESKAIGVRLMAGITLMSMFLVTLLWMTLVSAHGATHPRTWQAQVAAESSDHAIQGMAFLPSTLWINVGDKVVWTVKAGEIHTVTFLRPGQKPPAILPAVVLQASHKQGSSMYDGRSYYNSGLLSSIPVPGLSTERTYTLTFGVVGDFTYHCLIHPSMIGIIHVRPAGTSYPFSQQAYNSKIATETSTILSDGHKLAARAQKSSNAQQVTLGIGDGLVGVMRFFPQQIVIPVGKTVTFTNRDPMVPHTVSFGTFPPGTNNFVPFGHPKAFNGAGLLNSGWLGADPAWHGTTYKVTFVKAGTYHFYCDLHDYLGMVATIVVQ